MRGDGGGRRGEGGLAWRLLWWKGCGEGGLAACAFALLTFSTMSLHFEIACIMSLTHFRIAPKNSSRRMLIARIKPGPAMSSASSSGIWKEISTCPSSRPEMSNSKHSVKLIGRPAASFMRSFNAPIAAPTPP